MSSAGIYYYFIIPTARVCIHAHTDGAPPSLAALVETKNNNIYPHCLSFIDVINGTWYSVVW